MAEDRSTGSRPARGSHGSEDTRDERDEGRSVHDMGGAVGGASMTGSSRPRPSADTPGGRSEPADVAADDISPNMAGADADTPATAGSDDKASVDEEQTPTPGRAPAYVDVPDDAPVGGADGDTRARVADKHRSGS